MLDLCSLEPSGKALPQVMTIKNGSIYCQISNGVQNHHELKNQCNREILVFLSVLR